MYVLVADDDVVTQQVVMIMLETDGHRVDVAADGREALARTRRDRYDLVLMDCEMPGMDGLAAVRAIRADESGRQDAVALPVVAMTGYDTPADRAMCLAAGMTTFLAKPVTPEQLRSLLATVRGTASLLQPAAARSTETDRCGERAAFDTSIIDALPMVADGSEPGFAAELLAIFVRRTRQLLTELGAAATASDRQEMVRCAHTMKSSSAIIGALALADRARTYEMRLRAGETPANGWLDLLQRDFAHFETAAQRYLAANGSSGMRAG